MAKSEEVPEMKKHCRRLYRIVAQSLAKVHYDPSIMKVGSPKQLVSVIFHLSLLDYEAKNEVPLFSSYVSFLT
jgi:hypothetical protein